jgi:hypothetical protein
MQDPRPLALGHTLREERMRDRSELVKAGLATLTLGGLCVLGAVALLAYNWKWVRNVWAGPVTRTPAQLRQVRDPAAMKNSWVSYTPPQVVDSGARVETKKRGVVVSTTRLVFLQAEDAWLLAEVPGSYSGGAVLGHLSVWRPARVKKLDEVKGRQPPGALLPYQMDAVYDYKTQCYFLLGVAGLLLVLGLPVCFWGVGDLCRKPAGEEEPRPRRRRRVYEPDEDG